MTDTNASNSRICPNCGHANTSYSLFCAECGESLNTADNNDDSGQTTALFTPVTSGQGQPESYAASPDDRYATAEFIPQSAATTTDTDPAMTGWYASPGVPAYESAAEPESRRGFWLGIIASILILLILAFFAWSTLATDNFRDTVTGIF